MKDGTQLEYELNTEQCIEVAVYMYSRRQEAMKPPLYAYYDFITWLKRQQMEYELESLKAIKGE
jgi:hypothetical protein